MTIQDRHEALVQRHREIDPTLAAVLARGNRIHRRRRRLAGVAVAVTMVAAVGIGIGIASAGPSPRTRVTTAAATLDPASSSRATTVASTGTSRQVHLQASDWREAARDGTPSRAAGAHYTVTSGDGQVLVQGSIDPSGEATFRVPSNSEMLSVDECNYAGPLIDLEPGVINTMGFPCLDGATVLPSQRIPVTTGNPTDDELRAALQDAARCIEASGLIVSHVSLTVDASGVAHGMMQVGLANSGMTLDESDVVENRCRTHYESLMSARGTWLREHGRLDDHGN